MDIEKFFDLFMEELKQDNGMSSYYKFLNNKKKFYFRKNYFCRRLKYIQKHVGSLNNFVWDCGCGYGTTAIFLTLNGYKIHGTTLEYYYEHIPKRIKYWSKFGDMETFSYHYSNLFDSKLTDPVYDIIIAQDTLHHLEPINEALAILYKILKPKGKLIAIEENGKNLFQRFKNFLHRGNKKIIEIYDKKLNRKILLGNENIRSFKHWYKLFKNGNFLIDNCEYIRYFLPFKWSGSNYESLQKRENEIWIKNRILRDYFYFGVNFVAKKVIENYND